MQRVEPLSIRFRTAFDPMCFQTGSELDEKRLTIRSVSELVREVGCFKLGLGLAVPDISILEGLEKQVFLKSGTRIFAELSGELSAAICLKTLSVLSHHLECEMKSPFLPHLVDFSWDLFDFCSNLAESFDKIKVAERKRKNKKKKTLFCWLVPSACSERSLILFVRFFWALWVPFVFFLALFCRSSLVHFNRWCNPT